MLKLGYHPATYLRQDVATDHALADISATGWDGFEWSSGGLGQHYSAPDKFKSYLDAMDLEVSGIYCPCGFRTDDNIREWQTTVAATTAFAQEIGTQFIMIDGGSLELPQTAASTEKIAGFANEVGREVRDAGLTCTWHQHWGTLFQYPAEFDALMAATDPELVKCTPASTTSGDSSNWDAETWTSRRWRRC